MRTRETLLDLIDRAPRPAVNAFNPSQKRDTNGQWTRAGGGLMPGGAHEHVTGPGMFDKRILTHKGEGDALRAHAEEVSARINADPAARAAVTEYTAGDHAKINTHLRTGAKTPDPATEAHVAALDKLTNADLPHEVTTYRGFGKATGRTVGRLDKAIESGKPLTEKGFTSTTLDPGTAQGFVDHGNSLGRALLELRTKKGAYLERATGKPGEHEVLLPRGLKYKVTGKRVAHINGSVHMIYEAETV